MDEFDRREPLLRRGGGVGTSRVTTLLEESRKSSKRGARADHGGVADNIGRQNGGKTALLLAHAQCSATKSIGRSGSADNRRQSDDPSKQSPSLFRVRSKAVLGIKEPSGLRVVSHEFGLFRISSGIFGMRRPKDGRAHPVSRMLRVHLLNPEQTFLGGQAPARENRT
jgi:hypothetical protein